MPSLEERRARVHAELNAKNSEEKAIAWEQEHNKIYEQLTKATSEKTELNRLHEALKTEIQREREQTNTRVEALIMQAETYKQQYNSQCGENTQLKNKITDLSENLKATGTDRDKWRDRATAATISATKANEDYLDIARKLESANEALERKDNLLKRTIRVKA